MNLETKCVYILVLHECKIQLNCMRKFHTQSVVTTTFYLHNNTVRRTSCNISITESVNIEKCIPYTVTEWKCVIYLFYFIFFLGGVCLFHYYIYICTVRVSAIDKIDQRHFEVYLSNAVFSEKLCFFVTFFFLS